MLLELASRPGPSETRMGRAALDGGDVADPHQHDRTRFPCVRPADHLRRVDGGLPEGLRVRLVPGGHGSGTTFPLRLFMTMFGVSFATIGVGFENFPQILQDGDRAKRYIVAFLFLADGSLHLYAFNDHLGDLFSATFFALFSVLQLAAAFIIPYTRFRLDLAWLGITAFLILAYIVTRTMAVWPIGVVEEVEPLGVVSKLVEVLTILVLVSLMQSERTASRSSVEASAVPNR